MENSTACPMQKCELYHSTPPSYYHGHCASSSPIYLANPDLAAVAEFSTVLVFTVRAMILTSSLSVYSSADI